jgi:hypothetical protein
MLRKTITQMLRNETMGDNLKTTKKQRKRMYLKSHEPLAGGQEIIEDKRYLKRQKIKQ